MILVFGAQGQVARELDRRGQVTPLGRAACDLMTPGKAAEAIAAHTPELVINAAAYTAVDAAEDAPDAAHRLNAEAPAEIARACVRRDIPLVHFSTDYVYDGSGTPPRTEDAPTAPLNTYGRTKLAGEDAIRASGARAAILRTSWVFSAHGTNFVKTMLRLSQTRDALDVVADQHGGPTPAAAIADAALTLGQALRNGAAGGTWHFAGQPAISWAGFARAIFDRAGLDVTVRDIATADWPTPARRPLNSRLDCGALLRDHGIAAPDWRAGLDDVLKELGAT
ncbi:dTDP-4-dehydrorhamnose reductase [Pseudooceanicola aestuarii]|uniref:dTDP-4-dehydrorhamnose reductase n=1 Tax=Pseudooceanicola aestuarii TaxID=2697319 RepID=UPI0013D23193|nr:dTDP-4-dehydrorhamnose reductase [Pseudooceanicola aestuarii]